MNGIQIEYLLGLFFLVTGLAAYVVIPAGQNRSGAVVTIVAAVLLLIAVYFRISLRGI